jgi:hypothetical protein
MEEDVQRYWDEQVATFDEERDHGLADPPVRVGSQCPPTDRGLLMMCGDG